MKKPTKQILFERMNKIGGMPITEDKDNNETTFYIVKLEMDGIDKYYLLNDSEHFDLINKYRDNIVDSYDDEYQANIEYNDLVNEEELGGENYQLFLKDKKNGLTETDGVDSDYLTMKDILNISVNAGEIVLDARPVLNQLGVAYGDKIPKEKVLEVLAQFDIDINDVNHERNETQKWISINDLDQMGLI
jgi:hypothetical protein